MNINEEPIEVILTRQLQALGPIFDEFHHQHMNAPGHIDGWGKQIIAVSRLDRQTRRYLWRAVGWAPCDELGETHCNCEEGEPPRPITDWAPCTGNWRGCDTCNQEYITYADGVGEYDICKACHWDGKCLNPKLHACGGPRSRGGGCEVYPDRHPVLR